MGIRIFIILCLLLIPIKTYGEENHVVEFINLEDTYIDFDYEENKWVYNGDLKEIETELKLYFEQPYYMATGIILIEILRQLKEENR